MTQPTSGAVQNPPRGTLASDAGALRQLEDAPGLLLVDVFEHHASPGTRSHGVTVNLRCAWSGWTSTRSASSSRHVLAALTAALDGIPFEAVALDFGRAHRVIDETVRRWAIGRGIGVLTQRVGARAVSSACSDGPDQWMAEVDCADASAALESVNRRWELVNEKANFLVPLRRTTGWSTDVSGRRRPLRDAPRTPLARILQAGVLSRAQADELRARRDALDPAETIRGLRGPRSERRVDAWSRAVRR